MTAVLQTALLMVFPLAMAFAAATDFLTYTIPNKISLVLVLAFVAIVPFADLTWPQVGMHVVTGFAVLCVGFALFSAALLGGGDAKLLAAAALWIGHENLLAYVTMVAVCGGVLGIVLIAYRRLPLPQWLRDRDWAQRLHQSGGGMPYGIALAAAGLWIYPSTPWFAGLAA
jgi:prepilin peptidase CpaA